MNTNSLMRLGTIEAIIVRKPIKNLHLSILPPNGWVRVTAPLEMKDETVRTLLSIRLPWIKKQQYKFINQERQTRREYVSGESHFLFGKKYRLVVMQVDTTPTVTLKGKSQILLQVRPGSSITKKQEVLNDWYRHELHKKITELVDEWEERIGVNVGSWKIKIMKTRWGTCNHESAKIIFNLELAKKPIESIEYVVVHELIHIIEKKHSVRFMELMTKYIPKWKSIKDDLGRLALSFYAPQNNSK